jgi:small multidrug resistance pump
MIDIYTGIFLFAVFIASCAQILLKSSANIKHESLLKEYLNKRVIGSYFILFISAILGIVAFRGVELKQGPIFEATSYIWVIFLSSLFLHERITIYKVIGTFLIIFGIVVFYD